MLPDWDCCFNYEKHFLGRIWVCWNRAEVKVSVLDKSAQCINCHIHSIKENSDWFQSFIYGANKPVERRLLWQNLFSMKMMVSSKPWILDGDFNVVRNLVIVLVIWKSLISILVAVSILGITRVKVQVLWLGSLIGFL
jgi:hypothetical protein